MALYNAKIVKNSRVFLITPSPTEKNIKEYIDLLKSNSINLVIKVTVDKLYDHTIYKENNDNTINNIYGRCLPQ